MSFVRQFGGGSAEGRARDKALLGGKGANLAEMASLGLPVPPGFTITTEVSRYVMEHGAGNYPAELAAQVKTALAQVEALTKTTFGDGTAPLLVSVRSGAPRFDAGDDGYDPQPRPQRRHRRRAREGLEQRALRVGLLPPLRRDVRRAS
jgi:hypothetical protein